MFRATVARWQTRTGRWLHAYLAFAAISLLLLSLWLAYDAGRSVNTDLTLAEHTRAVQHGAETLLSTLRDVEIGQRSYLLTDSPAERKAYDAARVRLDADLANLESMLPLAPEWAATVQRIRTLASDEVAALDHAIDLHQSGKTDAARDIVRTADDKRMMDALRIEAGALQTHAAVMLESALGHQANLRTPVGPMSLTIGAAMLLGYLAFTQLRARRAADASLAERIRLDEALGLFPGILRNLDGRIIAWGQGAERLYGYPAAQAIGRLSHSLLQTEFPCPLGEIEAALLHDGLWRGELVHRHRDGSRLVIASHWALRPAGKRGPALVIEVNNDITALRQADAAIRESEERLRAATEAAGVGLVLVNREHRYRFANKAYADILELPSHDIVGQRVADVLTSMYADQIRPRLLRAFEGDRVVYELTRPAIPRHQAERHYAVTYELSRVAADEPVVVVVITEITERIAATHALLDRERMLQLALEASDLGIWRCETAQTGGTLDWDARCKAIFGFPTEHPVTFDAWKNAVPEDEWDIVEAELTRTLSPDDPRDDYACAYPVRRPDGALRWVAAVGRTFFEPDVKAPSGRRAVRIIGTMRDVTEARRDEQERQRNDELLRTILSTAPGLIYAKDWAGRFLVANEPVHALYGKPWADMQGRTDRQILNNSAESEALMQTDRRVMAAGATEVVEELFGEDDGLARVWLSTKTPLRSADGRIVGIVGVSLEITERKRYENRLQLMVHELNHRVKNTLATIQAIAAHSLRQADTSIRQTFENRLLALSAAHDVLTRESWAGASINEVVAAALAPFGGSDSSRFQVVGPELRLLPRAALALSMGLHELATNAAKYGALLCDAGTVTVQWSIRDGRLRLVWSEQGGPVVLPASRCGFGMRLVERSVARDLGGTAVISFEPDGISCSIEAPLESIASSAQVLWLPDVGNTSAR